MSYKGFDIVSPDTPPDWGLADEAQEKQQVDCLVMGCCSEEYDAAGHKHKYLHKSDGSAVAVSVDATGNVSFVEDIYLPSLKKIQLGGTLDSEKADIIHDTATTPDETRIENLTDGDHIRIKQLSSNSGLSLIILETGVGGTSGLNGVLLVGKDFQGNTWGSAGAGKYRRLLVDESGYLIESDTDVNIDGDV